MSDFLQIGTYSRHKIKNIAGIRQRLRWIINILKLHYEKELITIEDFQNAIESIEDLEQDLYELQNEG